MMTEEISRGVGRAMKAARKKYTTLTQAQAAEVVGMSAHWMSKVEQGTRNVDADKLVLLAREYGCSVSELVGEVD